MTKNNSAQEFFRLGQEAVDSEKKLKFYDKALELDPENVEILMEKAEIFANRGESEEAIKVYDKAIKIEPENDYILWNKIQILVSESVEGENGEFDDWTLKRFKEALNIYDKIIKILPNDIDMLYEKASLLDDLGQTEEAIKVYDKAINIEPENVDTLRKKASLLNELGQTEEAIKIYDKAINIEPENADILWEKAILLGKIGQTEEAIKIYDKAIKIDSENNFIIISKAESLIELGQAKEAIKVYDEALEIKPESVLILIHKANLLISLNKKDEALSIVYNKGNEFYKNEDYKNAFDCFKYLTNINEKRVDIWIKKGDAKFKLDNYKQAKIQYKKALKIEPNNAEAWHKKGKAHEKIGELNEAKKCYEEALKIDPTYDSSKNYDENVSTYNLTDNMNTNQESGTEDFDITSLYFEPKQKKIIISQVTTALKNGKHIILSGPPGTGKSKLAKEICDFHKNDYHMCTATSDWSTFETIGGYRPDEDNKLQFFPGIFLQCFKDNNDKPSNHWLIIDEMNRADIDKAFGSLFSALTGDDVILPFKMSDEFIKIVGKFDKDATYGANHFVIPDDWQIIATMNTFDKSSLYEMSYAFMRRFAFIPIDVPQEINTGMVREYVKCWGMDKNQNQIYSNLSDLWNLINESRKIGPAIIEDLYKYIEETNDYTSALILFVLPQFEGLMEKDQIFFVKKILKDFDFVNDHDRLKGFVSDFFGIDPREFNSNESDK